MSNANFESLYALSQHIQGVLSILLTNRDFPQCSAVAGKLNLWLVYFSIVNILPGSLGYMS